MLSKAFLLNQYMFCTHFFSDFKTWEDYFIELADTKKSILNVSRKNNQIKYYHI